MGCAHAVLEAGDKCFTGHACAEAAHSWVSVRLKVSLIFCACLEGCCVRTCMAFAGVLSSCCNTCHM